MPAPFSFSIPRRWFGHSAAGAAKVKLSTPIPPPRHPLGDSHRITPSRSYLGLSWRVRDLSGLESQIRWAGQGQAILPTIPMFPATATAVATAPPIRLFYADRRIGTKRISTR